MESSSSEGELQIILPTPPSLPRLPPPGCCFDPNAQAGPSRMGEVSVDLCESLEIKHSHETNYMHRHQALHKEEDEKKQLISA